ncbi:MAG: hypothetical protein LUG18_14510, partial [Candidatus Azobacteroides sp.]|nr:hypothetical protein [Candidatus Azobacteroides sp.]
VEGITGDACFVVAAQEFPYGDNYAKRAVVEVDCADIKKPIIEFSLPSQIFIDETIALSASSINVTNPVYTYYVTAPGVAEAVVTTFPYAPTEGVGTYTFRVGVAEAALPFLELASATAEVEVKAIPAPFTVTVDISNTDWTQVAIWYWGYGNYGEFAVPTLVKEGVYSYTFTRMEEIGVIFVESDGITWPADEDYDTRLGKQTVNVEGITGDACYVVGDQEFPLDADYAKRTVEACAEAAPAVESYGVTTISNEKKIELNFAGSANVEVYTIGGILLVSQAAEHQFSYPVSEGIYVVRVNDEVLKVLVK